MYLFLFFGFHSGHGDSVTSAVVDTNPSFIVKVIV